MRGSVQGPHRHPHPTPKYKKKKSPHQACRGMNQPSSTKAFVFLASDDIMFEVKVAVVWTQIPVYVAISFF